MSTGRHYGKDEFGTLAVDLGWLGSYRRDHAYSAHVRADIDSEDYREKANGMFTGLDI